MPETREEKLMLLNAELYREGTVPFIVYEATQARHERTVKRFIVALIIVTMLLFASNTIWVFLWSQYEYIGEESYVDINSGEGAANYIGNDGDIYNGTNNSPESN